MWDKNCQGFSYKCFNGLPKINTYSIIQICLSVAKIAIFRVEYLRKVKGDDGFSDVCKNGKGGEEITVKTSLENIG